MSSSPTSRGAHAQSSTKAAEYLVRTSELPPSVLERRVHPIVSTNYRYQLSLGDSTGLTKLGVHLCRLSVGATSTTLHWHSHEDEWLYILEAGEDAVLLVWEPEEEGSQTQTVIPRAESVRAGDFLGFKAGVERAHALKAGENREMVYLVGGSREPLDVAHYPEVGRRTVTDSAVGGERWDVEDSHVRSLENKAPPTLPPTS